MATRALSQAESYRTPIRYEDVYRLKQECPDLTLRSTERSKPIHRWKSISSMLMLWCLDEQPTTIRGSSPRLTLVFWQCRSWIYTAWSSWADDSVHGKKYEWGNKTHVYYPSYASVSCTSSGCTIVEARIGNRIGKTKKWWKQFVHLLKSLPLLQSWEMNMSKPEKIIIGLKPLWSVLMHKLEKSAGTMTCH